MRFQKPPKRVYRSRGMNDIPPHSVEAEMCALGSAMLSRKALKTLMSRLNADKFFLPAHKAIFEAMYWLDVDEEEADLVTVKNRLVYMGKLQEAGGTEYLINLNEVVPTASNAEHYCTIVEDYWILRELQDRGRGIDELIKDPSKSVEEKLAEAADITKGLTKGARAFEAVDQIVMSDDDEQDYLPLMLGGGALGAVIGGLYKGQITTYEFPTGHGKTMSAIETCHLLLKANPAVKVIYVTLADLQPKDIKKRLVTQMCGLRRRPGGPEQSLYAADIARDQKAWDDAVATVNGWGPRFKVYGAAKLGADSSVEGIIAALDAELEKEGADCVVIDYAQKLTTRAKSESMTADATRTAAGLGLFAGRWGQTAFIILSQISKDGDTSWAREWMNQAAVRVQGVVDKDLGCASYQVINWTIQKHRFLPVEGASGVWHRHNKKGTLQDM